MHSKCGSQQANKLTSLLSCSNKKAQSVWLSTQASLNAESFSHLKQSFLILPFLTFCTHGKPFWNKRLKDQSRKLVLNWIADNFSCKKEKRRLYILIRNKIRSRGKIKNQILYLIQVKMHKLRKTQITQKNEFLLEWGIWQRQKWKP